MLKSVLIVTSTLSLGGISSFLVCFANEIYRQGNDVTIAHTGDNANIIERFDSGVHFIQYSRLNKKEIIFQAIKNGHCLDLLRIKLRQHDKISPIFAIQHIAYDEAQVLHPICGEYDVVISSAEFFCNAYVAFKIDAPKKIGWVHPDIKALSIDINESRKVLDKLDTVVTVSEAGLRSLREAFPENSKKFIHINNLIDVERIRRLSMEAVIDMEFDSSFIKVVTVCRIDNSSKRLDRIVRIAAILKRNQLNFKWFVVGDGRDMGNLKQMVTNNKLNEDVCFLGNKDNPYPYIKNADWFVLTSQYEGKPVVIEEAKALHVPVIVTNYASAFEQIKPENGYIVPNTDGILESEIAKLISITEVNNVAKHNAKSYLYNNYLIKNQIMDLIK